MALLRFRVYWEEDDQIYRDIEIQASQTFLDFHYGILKAFEFDSKHDASFYESDDRWERKRELSSEVLTNKKDAPALSMVKTPVSALVSLPDQKFVYVYDRVKKWTFHIELISVSKDIDHKRTYPYMIRKEGVAPGQYGIKGVNVEKLMDVEEKYDLGADEMAEGFGNEGESNGSDDATDSGSDEGHEEFGGAGFDE